MSRTVANPEASSSSSPATPSSTTSPAAPPAPPAPVVALDPSGAVRILTGGWPVVAALGAVLVVWKAITVSADLPVFVLPPPERVAQRFVSAWADGTLAPHAWTTIVEAGTGFAVGAAGAIVVGYGLARSPWFERLFAPYLVGAQAVPILALAPLLALWFQTGLTAKVLIVAVTVFFPVAIATMVGIRSVDRGLLELGRSLRASRSQILWTIEIPAAMPSILGGLRVAVPLAVLGAIVGEWAGADKGLGVLINLARASLFDYPLMFATLLTIALIGIAGYVLVVLAERRLVGLR